MPWEAMTTCACFSTSVHIPPPRDALGFQSKSNAVSWLATVCLARSPLPSRPLSLMLQFDALTSGSPCCKIQRQMEKQFLNLVLYDQQSGDSPQNASIWCCSMGSSLGGVLPTAYTPLTTLRAANRCSGGLLLAQILLSFWPGGMGSWVGSLPFYQGVYPCCI